MIIFLPKSLVKNTISETIESIHQIIACTISGSKYESSLRYDNDIVSWNAND